ncbi:Conserved hypothetical protein CHP02464 [Penicillium cf. griseofulvum]|uniref:NADAR domain-containing protein n=1 Tax=Penicillium cf. griseofulvum TaxID=2972120 RepID=A0A9W9IZP2_9EURO|nr:Conserved hypothetical protein CHP02464 [Penicillium cf. griseofulvum]KAJ5423046.1 Conserved hypothetical protein CHP02464 [Penicillium cf. griseofulvum]KAJ5433735.1 Conserved hypothetical protein CHP02464 [Penicillium cf. griseofulvum]
MDTFQQHIEDHEANGVMIKNPIFFWKVTSNFGEFSQWYISDFVCDDEKFSTAEQYMMYKKALMFGDTRISEKILCSSSASPRKHKSMGRMVANFDPDIWESRNMNVVINANYCKFTQDVHLMEILLDTADNLIIEASPTDRVWGIGFDSAHAMVNVGRWGQNRLGRSLMSVRSMIKDVLTRMPTGMRSRVPVDLPVIALCYHCISTTTITPSTGDCIRSEASLMITTCSDCMKTHVLSTGRVDRSTLTTMMELLPAETKALVNSDMILSKTPYMIIHPDVLKFLDTSSCTVSRMHGFKDSNGMLVHDWTAV